MSGWSTAAQQPTAVSGWSSVVAPAQQPPATTTGSGWNASIAPAGAAAAPQNGGSGGSGPQADDDAHVEQPRAPEAPYVPPTELSKVMLLILERTEQLNGLRSAGTYERHARQRAAIQHWALTLTRIHWLSASGASA